MYCPEYLDIKNLSLTKPGTPFDQQLPSGRSLRICTLQHGDRPLTLYLHGSVAYAPTKGSEEYGGIISFVFKPSPSDQSKLVQLERLLLEGEPEAERLSEMIGFEYFNDDAEYVLRPTLTQDFYLRLKMRRKGDQWSFLCNVPLSETNMTEVLGPNTKVSLTLNAGFYFSEEDNRYGLYYTLKDLTLGDYEEKKTTKRPIQKRK